MHGSPEFLVVFASGVRRFRGLTVGLSQKKVVPQFGGASTAHHL